MITQFTSTQLKITFKCDCTSIITIAITSKKKYLIGYSNFEKLFFTSTGTKFAVMTMINFMKL